MKFGIIIILLLSLLLIAGIVFSAAFSPSLLSFNTGQVSPLLDARSDFQKYNSSCRIAQNVVVNVQGSVLRRPGTKYIADANSICRLISFEYSTDDAYVLEFGNSYIRFFRDN